MDELKVKINRLEKEINESFDVLNGPKIQDELQELRSKSENPDFWDDPQKAQDISKKIAKLDSKIGSSVEIISSVKELNELIDLGDESMSDELQDSVDKIDAAYQRLKEQLKFSGAYDDFDALVTISAGAGGVDAMDWAEMLERMYLRWIENTGLKVSIIDRSPGDEAGIKSSSFEVSGVLTYGKLKSEHGVHRLVRLSPFNADNLRQTSFAKVEVVPLIDEPDQVEIDDQDLKIDVYRSGGKGGQSVNTTDSAVRITHIPTGLVVAIQNERSQLQNKEKAMQILRSKLAQLKHEQHKDKISELKGPNEQAAWGNQIRSYVLHPYKMVKDLRTNYETSNIDAVLGGDLDGFIEAYLNMKLGQ